MIILPRQALINTVIKNSKADKWAQAVGEWDIDSRMVVDDSKLSKCVCDQPGLKYLFRINNRETGNSLFPIGSVCIHTFGREDLNRKVKVLQELYDMRKYSLQNISECSPKTYFSRQLIDEMRKANVVTEFEYQFMKKAFNTGRPLNVNGKKLLNKIVNEKIRPYGDRLEQGVQDYEQDGQLLEEQFGSEINKLHSGKPSLV